ncbi:tRNA pseudouridine(55) synthase TruB [Stigmatella sp. ncwal1]|uniref:tRNA pseudouridine synthase B n=1 Tax=Stigmatella ashevillensis TaxID=2995309 RepID=A0ABT5D966_9BACT|nr:tRNA pseudouridine(55) synthase TruB [Stigmatella ashevillena]MDC0710220.1 tRNA pseudouridine(55) synthase TruB [Stigmatella ashevillena]
MREAAPLEPGIHLVHKPLGETSFTSVRAAMAELEAARPGKRVPVCHGGTLDPFAEGLLLLLVGQATRLMDLLHAVPKRYVAQVLWGSETDNGDLLGRVVHQGDPSALTPEALEAALGGFRGWHDQVPPATSAKKLGGEPAYRKAHRGEEVVLPPSRVYLHEARWLSHDLPRSSRLELVCRGGFYVRSLARELGRRLGCGAHLARLHRTAIGPWEDPGPGRRVGLHGRQLLPWSALRELSDAEVGELRRERPIALGRRLPPEWRLPPGFPDPQAPVRGFHLGRWVALLQEQEGTFRMKLELRGGL